MIPPQAIKLIRQFEGCSLEPYQDPVGIWTCGIGHAFLGCEPVRAFTTDEAEDVLRQDLQEADDAIAKLVTVPLTENQRAALLSWVFNLGETRLKNSTLLKKLNAGDYDGAAREFPKWSLAGGIRLDGLMRRRIAEQSLFLHA
jgi:lysozyme